MPLVLVDLDSPFSVGPCAVAADLIGHFAKRGAQVAVAKGEYGVQVHGRTALWHQAADHTRRRLVFEEFGRDLKHCLSGAALAHANQHDALAHGHDVTASEAYASEGGVAVAPPDREVRTLEARMELVDRPLEQRFRFARGPVHRVARDAVVDPAG